MGFEPTSRLRDYLISSQGRYDHFDTYPYIRRREAAFLPICAACFPPLHMSHIILPKLGAKIKCFFFARAIFKAFCALCGGAGALNA